jgi:uncharacterized protein YcsI (UPF0317 family)
MVLTSIGSIFTAVFMPVDYSENRLLLASRNGKACNAREVTRHGWNLENGNGKRKARSQNVELWTLKFVCRLIAR